MGLKNLVNKSFRVLVSSSFLLGAPYFINNVNSLKVTGKVKQIKEYHEPILQQNSCDSYFILSPDGEKIVFRKNGNPYVMDSDGYNKHRLNIHNFFSPAWSPDSKKIAFTSIEYFEDKSNADIYTVNIDGSNLKRLTHNLSYDDWAAWSPDGTKITFTSRRDGNYQIYTMNPDGSNQINLSKNSYTDNLPTWFPDGSKIAFNSSRDGIWGLYVMNADGSNQTMPIDSSGNLYWPPWDVDQKSQKIWKTKPINAKGKNSILIFVDSKTYDKIPEEIQRYGEDISKDKRLNTQVNILINEWKSSKNLRDIIIKHYKTNNLLGSIFIGDIPVENFEISNGSMVGDNIISDLYFEDLDRTFHDEDQDGAFEFTDGKGCNQKEVWSARIKPPVKGKKGIKLLKKYFEKNHKFRTKKVRYKEDILFFDKLKEEPYLNQLRLIYNMHYPLFRKIKYIGDNISKLENKLKENYEFSIIHAHGLPKSNQAFDYKEMKKLKPNSFFIHLYSCSNGKFDVENYFAGWSLFSGDTLVVRACSDICSAPPYDLLNVKSIFGEAHKQNYNIQDHLFGDPTLRFNFHDSEVEKILDTSKVPMP